MRWEMMKEDTRVSSTQAWGCPHEPQEIFKVTQASKLGDAPVHPLLYQQSSVRPSPCYIFITSYVMCYAWSVPLFTFQFFQFFLLCITSRNLAYLVWEKTRSIPLQNTTQVFLLIFLCVLHLFVDTLMLSSQFSSLSF